jgi:hypothetical protein
MTHPLDGCIAKLNRANAHIADLEHRISRFVADSYRIETELDPKTFEYVARSRVLAEPPSLEWGGIISDAINGLRSGLDNLTWELSVSHFGPPPPDPIPLSGQAGRWRKVRFPIVTAPSRWSDAKGKALWAVRPGLDATFQGLQPYVRRKTDPWRSPLAILEELWNIDKHRHLHLVQVFIGVDHVASGLRELLLPEVVLPEDFQPAYTMTAKHARGPFVNGAELARFVQGGNIIHSLGGMDVQYHFSYDVAFDKGPPAYGGVVIDVLRRLSKFVRFVVRKFEPEFP